VHKYGPHIFHTNHEDVWQYVNQFTKFNDFKHRVKINYDESLYDWPITLDTINQFYNTSMEEKEAKEFIAKKCITLNDIDNFENAIIKKIGIDLYEALVKNYTAKQWGRDPRTLSSNFAPRVEIRYDNDKRFFKDKYQGMPNSGYTQMIQNMLDNKNISVILNSSIEDVDFEKNGIDLTIITSRIDEFYAYSLGELEYLTQDFDIKQSNNYKEFEDDITVKNYPELKHKFIRMTHLNKFYNYTSEKPNTYIIETPLSKNKEIVSYPVQDKVNLDLYKEYSELLIYQKCLFAGRLGTFKYMNMDVAIKQALDMSKEILKEI